MNCWLRDRGVRRGLTLEEGTTAKFESLYNASTSAVLFVRVSRRVLALTFGDGQTLLRADRIERSFGLRVALNTVGKDGLQSVDSKIEQELTVYTRRQASRTSELAAFGVDKEEDLLSSVAGVPREPSLARVVSGADALHLRAGLDFSDLGEKCRTIVHAYCRNEYVKQGFGFVDHVRSVTDTTVARSLNEKLVTSLVAGRFDDVHMAPPEIIDTSKIEGFGFTKRATPQPELKLESLCEQIRRPSELSTERLKRQRIFVHYADSVDAVPQWPIFRVLVAEQVYQRRRYVLSGGEW